jgi:two-component system, OmpR family, alkaline phosphatase synthesis response regulator PhoP
MKVLIAEDDVLTREGLQEILEAEGYTVITAADGKQAVELFESQRPDFVCLDIMMPAASGYDVCREIRALDKNVGLIFISAKSEELDKVLGLELGADDFIVKPFGVKEVVARVRAVTRRCLAKKHQPELSEFRMGELVIFPAKLRGRRGDEQLEFSLREIKLLKLFHENPGVVLDRDTIFNACWGQRYLPSSRTLDQHISRLRKRIESDPGNPTIIRTIHGAGYRWEGPAS